ncbi:ComEC/Rec2 family competence protein [Streptomyces sp. NBC_00237]|uniref:ComEC/Rec2 family competence protein n=1 Tax=Streptomyces sp. NBC_00237 TaxID=2975687 RepID=UPI00224D59DF|nr:ComEC/Rec2 family competence protein [Streptomyces sp. NBC_00237]MCX5201271.1 ComEC/Rec2 family competence protein [Streptomyces sp. NBC_00237]
MHAASGHRLGASDPHQEGPADLRLVPPALAAWAAAAVTVGAPAATAVLLLAVVLAGAVAAVLLTARGPARSAPVSPGSGAGRAPEGGASAGGALGATVAGSRLPRRVTAVVTALLCAAAAAASAALHSADLHRGPVPELARRHAVVEVEATVTGDPRRTRPRVQGDRATPGAVVLDAELTRVTTTDGAVTAVRTPVLVVAPVRGPTAQWLRLLPSTRLKVTGARLAPPVRDGDRIAAVLRVPGDAGPLTITPPNTVQRTAGTLRAGLQEATEDLPPDARALLPGLVVGDTSRMEPDLHDAFESTDLVHLTAVSGSNLTIVLVLLIGPPSLAPRAERRGLAALLGLSLRTTALGGGVLTLAFVIVCRPEPSVLRAAACGLITLLAIGTGRRRSLIPALAAAVLLLILYDPWLGRSYGFLLSVLATGALLTFGPRWSAGLQRRGVPPRLAEVLAAACAAQAVCAPVIAVLAARVGLVAIPCNLLAELAVAPATVLGFAALAVAPAAMPVAELLARVAGWPAGWIAGVARAGAALPGAEIGWPGGWQGGALLAAVTIAVVFALRRAPRHPWLSLVCVLLLLLAVLRPVPLTGFLHRWPPEGWRFVLCDVGQGDATVLAAGEKGSAVVVDAGPDPVRVDRCLRDLGVTRVPLVLLSHFHADHVSGLPGVLRGRDVGEIRTTPLAAPRERAEFVRRAAARARVPVTAVRPGERYRVGPLDGWVLWPPPPPAPVPGEPNDASVTLFVRHEGPQGVLTLLLPGDLEPPAQQGLLRAHPALPPVDVLKVPHHGSAHQDPGLLHRVAPRLALVPVGRDNPYGHPAPTALAALGAQGAVVLRTDRDGAIAVVGAGEELAAVPLGG